MKKVYLLYLIIPKIEFENRIYTLVENKYNYTDLNDENVIGLYAFTTKKSYLKEFFEVRNKERYYVKKLEMEPEEFSEWRVEHITAELSHYELNVDGKNKVDVLCTKFEYTFINDYSSEIVMDTLMLYPVNDYMLFKDEYQIALDSIGYTTFYDTLIGGDSHFYTEEEIEERIAYADYNLSYGMTVFGQKFPINLTNQFNLLISLFRFSFV